VTPPAAESRVAALTSGAERKQPVQSASAPPAGGKPQVQEQKGAGWPLPALVAVLFAVLGIGGAVMFTNFKKPIREADELPESVSTSQPCINRVRQELAPGEELIWAGLPSPRATRFKTMLAIGMCLGMSLFAGVGLMLLLATTRGAAAPPWPIVGGFGLFVVIGLVAAFLVPRNIWWIAERTTYSITNRRAIVHKPSLFGPVAVDSYGPVQLQQMVRRDWFVVKGVGDLIFHTERRLEVSTTRNRHGSSSSVREKIIHFGFLGIDDPVKIEKVIRQILINPLVDKIQA
jgi:hypothetical protein